MDGAGRRPVSVSSQFFVGAVVFSPIAVVETEKNNPEENFSHRFNHFNFDYVIVRCGDGLFWRTCLPSADTSLAGFPYVGCVVLFASKSKYQGKLQ